MEHFHVEVDVKQEREAFLAASLLVIELGSRCTHSGRRHGRLFYAERVALSPRDPLMPVGFANGVRPGCSAQLC